MSEKRRDGKGRILRNGEVQRPDGKYMFRYIDIRGRRRTAYSWKLVETDKVPDNKRCTESLRELEKRIQRDVEDELDIGVANTLTLNNMFDRVMDLRTDLKMTTRCNYICLYDKHIRDSFGRRKISSIKPSDVQKLYKDFVYNQGLSTSTVRTIHCIIYQLFASAVTDSFIRINPASNGMKNLGNGCGRGGEKRHALTEEQQASFIEYVYGSNIYSRFGVLFTVLLGTGMRIGEALGLRWCDCDFEKNVISVNHTLLYRQGESGSYEYRISEPKTKAGMRLIPMLSDVKIALLKQKQIKPNPSWRPFVVNGYTDFIFLNNNGKVFTPTFVFDVIQDITNTYNREEYFNAEKENREPCYLPKFSAHILRHTFCTRLCENESNLKIIQDVMGHRNIRTTMDVYNEATAAKKQESFQNLEGKFKLI